MAPRCSTAPSRPTSSSSASAGAIGVEAAIGRHDTTLSILVVLALVGFLGSVSIARFAAPDTDRSSHDDVWEEDAS